MTFRKKVFVSQKITVIASGRELHVQALVSTYGAKYLFEESELPEALRHAADQELEVLYKKVPVRCRLVKETMGAGTVYSLRFLNPSGLLLRQIERDVRESGLPSPWLRALPRLNTTAKHLPIPALAVLDYQGSTLFLNVKNFTLGGLSLEFSGVELEDAKLGDRLNFDLVTNGGDKISDVSAVITHVAMEKGEAVDACLMQLGVRFLPMNLLSESKYRNLIREHCLGLREESSLTIG